MKVYIAACFEQQAEVRDKANDLALVGIECVSRWRFENSTDGMGTSECAQADLEDIQQAEVLVILTSHTSTRGGKHVEFGYALALEKLLMIVGHKENVFHNLPNVVRVQDWAEAIQRLVLMQEAIQDKGVIV